MKLHPASPAIDYALYLKGLVNFNDNLGMFAFYLTRQDLSERDQKAAKESFESFKRTGHTLPRLALHAGCAPAHDYIVNSLAQYEVHVARYYYSRGAYVAAINRAQRDRRLPRRAGAGRSRVHPGASYDALGMANCATTRAACWKRTTRAAVPEPTASSRTRPLVEVLVRVSSELSLSASSSSAPTLPGAASAAAPQQPPPVAHRPSRVSHTTSTPLSVSRGSGALPPASAPRPLRAGIVVERAAALRFQPLRARLDQRIVGRRERQLVDHHQLQRIAGHVECLPRTTPTPPARSPPPCVAPSRKRSISTRLGHCPCTSTSMSRESWNRLPAAYRRWCARRAAWSSAPWCGRPAGGTTCGGFRDRQLWPGSLGFGKVAGGTYSAACEA
jgi:hypothetical protein